MTAYRDHRDLDHIDRVRVLNGDIDAFEGIMRRHNQRLFRTARAVLGSDAEAEDAVQETYLRAYGALSSFKGPEGFATWLTRICLHHALDLRRKPAAITAHLPDDEDTIMQLPDTRTLDPERQAANAELRQMLEQAVDTLPLDFRLVFVLRAVDGMSTEETAAALELQAATVKTRLHRARSLMRHRLAQRLDQRARDIFAFDGARCDRIVARTLAALRTAAL